MTLLVRLNVSGEREMHSLSISCLVERVTDSNRRYYKIPSEESTMMAWLAQSRLNRHVERRMIGLS